ncbi:MAG: orange carotenoid protein N-terminal domain-containing protein [Cyanobacteria bacterium P01_D01_bin.1]
MVAATGNPTAQEEYKQQFDALSADEKLATLWYVYDGIGEERLENPDDNKESDSSSDLYNQIKGKSEEEQLQFMRDVLSGESNDLTNAYNNLSNTTKVALWYRLGQGMAEGSVIQVPSDYDLSDQAKQLVQSVNDINFEQSYIFVRDAIVG